jgi:hypothetical protein
MISRDLILSVVAMVVELLDMGRLDVAHHLLMELEGRMLLDSLEPKESAWMH